MEEDLTTLLDKLFDLPRRDYTQYSPLTLAYLGDAVYELLVRRHISLRHDCPAGRLHELCVGFVRAEAHQRRKCQVAAIGIA